ncbi:MAG: response regulator [Verrucomicrobiota bacterium]
MNTEFPILIAEDNENDAMILQRALRMVGFNNPFHISKNGADTIKYLQGEGEYSDREKHKFPRIVITDLKMPEIDGFELLQWLQKHSECGLIPRLVLSASQQESDVRRAYQLGAHSYVLKPAQFDELVANLRLVFDYWKMCRKPTLTAKC